ncbi:MAG: hypothetical protein ACO1N5_18985 [Noviherbaspirillum sp.]
MSIQSPHGNAKQPARDLFDLDNAANKRMLPDQAIARIPPVTAPPHDLPAFAEHGSLGARTG